MSKIGIDKNVPIPTKADRTTKYPWADMEIGDSFFVPKANKNTIASTSAAASVKYRHSYKTVEVVQGRTKGVRVWRIG